VIDKEFEFEISQNRINESQIETGLANIAIVGDKMKSKKGISGKLFNALGQNNINIRAIAQGASERNISIIIDENNTKKALNSLHETFFEDNLKDIHLFITGVGNVGGFLIDQIKNQKNFIAKNLKLNLKVIGISNSRKMIISNTEVNLDNWKKQLDESEIIADSNIFRKKF
jgi:aspartokinase/homoserine dehydrogenase 1